MQIGVAQVELAQVKKFGSGKNNTQLIVEKASWNSGF